MSVFGVLVERHVFEDKGWSLCLHSACFIILQSHHLFSNFSELVIPHA